MADIGVNPWRGMGIRLLIAVLALLIPFVALADEIHLKDGKRLTSPRAWVEGDYVHFILQGTTDVEIRYALEIVDRILTAEGKQIYPTDATAAQTPTAETVSRPETTPPAPAPAPTAVPTKSTEASQPKRIVKPEPAPKTPPPETPAVATERQPPDTIDTKLLRAKAKKLREIPFYDPRRAQKYWAASQSRHDNVQSAVAALAELFNRTPAWVTAHMGSTNDLGQIHLNLIRQLETKDQPQSASTTNETTAKAAGKTPAKTSVPIVSPKKAIVQPAISSKKAVRASNPFASNLPETHGILFYSPRRAKKFWANETSRHNTIEAALNALAEQYNRPVQWIEAHMGESNSLQEIHHNLTQAVQKESE